MAALPPNAYKPFGSGQRACIGRQFAMQEATLVLGMLLQRFDLIDHRGYDLKVKETLTIKPDGLRIKVQPRAGRAAGARAGGPAQAAGPLRRLPARPSRHPRRCRPPGAHNTPLLVLFGSNLGTAEGIATRLAREGAERGFAVTLGPLDDHARALPGDGAAIIVTASYNGSPPDNAAELLRVAAGPGHAAGRRQRPGLHRLRLRRHRLGRDLPGGAEADRHPAGGRRRHPRLPARRRQRRGRLRRPVRRLA